MYMIPVKNDASFFKNSNCLISHDISHFEPILSQNYIFILKNRCGLIYDPIMLSYFCEWDQNYPG